MNKVFSIIVCYSFCILYFTSGCANSEQQSQLDFVKFELKHALRLPNNMVSVQVINREYDADVIVIAKPMNNDAKWKKLEIFKRFTIKKEAFDELAESLIKLNDLDLNQAACQGKDGSSCSIEYGKWGASRSWHIWSPDYNTERRKLRNYFQLCKKLIEIGKLNPKEVF